MNAKDYENAMRAEVERWTGASISFAQGNKHRSLTVTVGLASRKTAYPNSPSDSSHGLANAIATLRRMLRDLGAQEPERQERAQDRCERRQRAQCKPSRVMPGERVERPDRFFGPLAALKAKMEGAQ